MSNKVFKNKTKLKALHSLKQYKRSADFHAKVWNWDHLQRTKFVWLSSSPQSTQIRKKKIFCGLDEVCQMWSMHGPASYKQNHNWTSCSKDTFQPHKPNYNWGQWWHVILNSVPSYPDLAHIWLTNKMPCRQYQLDTRSGTRLSAMWFLCWEYRCFSQSLKITVRSIWAQRVCCGWKLCCFLNWWQFH